MHRNRNTGARQSGAALLTALGLLVVFSLLGTAYLGFMVVQSEHTDLRVQEARATEAVHGAMRVAIDRIEGLLHAGQAPPEQFVFAFPVYMNTPEGLIAHEVRKTEAVVTVTEETGQDALSRVASTTSDAFWGAPPRTFLLRCEAHMVQTGPDGAIHRSAPVFAEAAAQFPEEGGPRIRYWSAKRR